MERTARTTAVLQLARLEATAASRERVTKSPRAAAIGVATLSGLTLYFLLRPITATMTRPRRKLAAEAVTTLLARRTRALERLRLCWLASQDRERARRESEGEMMTDNRWKYFGLEKIWKYSEQVQNDPA